MARKSHAVTAVSFFLLGATLAVTLDTAAGPKRRDARFEKLDVFARVLSYVESNYVENVDDRRLVYGAVKGMVRTLDPHSAFMTPDEFSDMRADTDGEFGGVGIEIDDDDGVLVVIEPIAGSPAARAGLVKGDRIVAIDGTSIRGKKDDSAGRLRGKPGTQVKITVERAGWEAPRNFTLVREIIRVAATDSMMLAPGIGYIRIKQFQERTDQEVIAALEKIQAASPRGVEGVVLDLRGNPGGLLDQAVRVADVFLDKGVIVTTVGRGGKKLEEESAREHGTWGGFPMVCLVNGGSASASEIVAGALQDHGRAVLVGTQTFGKGSVQSVYEFEDGSGLKLTVARYLTPEGRSIQEKGITPDVVVEQLDATKLKDARIDSGGQRERDLQGHLSNPAKDDRSAKNQPTSEAARIAEQALENDYQLKSAFQTLRSWMRFQKQNRPRTEGEKRSPSAVKRSNDGDLTRGMTER
jgi:carboxyl-terminal processing protease